MNIYSYIPIGVPMTIIEAVWAKTLSEKAVGLIGKKIVKPLFFRTRLGIHTFGMKKAIDVLILDEKYTIRSFKKGLVPNRIFLWNPRFSRVLELPDGSILKLNLTRGNKIILQLH